MPDEFNNLAAASILIAEDEMIVAEDLALTLTDLGYNVVGPVPSGQLAVELAEESKPDLILMDIKLRGEIDGIQATEHIRSRLDIPIIFLTAYEGTDTISRARVTEPYGFLAKPFSSHILKTTIETALYKHAADKRVKESEQRYRTLFEDSRDGVYFRLRNGEITDANPSFLEIFGYTREDVIGMNFRELYVDPADCLRFQEEIEKKGFVKDYEIKLRKKDGTEIESLLTSSVHYGEDGSVVGYRGILRDVTHHKRAAEALRESEERFRTVFEQGPLGMSILRPNLERVAINAKLTEMFGYTKEELRKLTFLDLTHPDDLELTREHIDKLLKKEIPFYQIEKRYIRKGGEIIWVRVTLSAVRDSQGELLYLVSMIEEITEHKRAEEAVRQANKEWERTFNAISDGIMVLDEQHKILRANKAMADALGMTRPELTGRFCFELVHGEKAPPAFCPHSQLLADGEEHSAEVMESSLGATLDVRVSPIHGRDGQVIGSVHVVRDITERKKAETALQRSHELLRAIIEAAPVAIIGLDLEGNVQMVWNPAAEKMLGWSAREVMGHPLPSVPVDKQQEFKGFRERIRSGKTLDGVEVRRQKRDGSPIDYSIYASPLHDDEGRITGNIAVLVDITEKKSLQSQLLQAQKMEAIGTLAGGIAHDFNNLLQAISGYSEFLLMNPRLEEKTFAGLSRIFQAARNGSDLVKGLLTLGGRLETQRKLVNLNHHVELVKTLLSRTIPKTIQIESYLGEDPLLINADPIQVEQVLMNLGVNARDAMPDGGRLLFETSRVVLDDVYCKSHVDVVPGEYVLLSVSDTGSGMDEQTVQQIFEPFFTTKREGRGTGLGLAITYAILKQHGGHMRCYSEPDMGTLFKIYFPAAQGKADVMDSALEPLPRGGTETILLVDDDEAIRSLGDDMLSELGYVVLTASNGEEALKIFGREREKISLVILDLMMPEMSGERCLQEILKIDPAARVLVASGYAEGHFEMKAKGTGARGFVHKPYEVRLLLERIREVLDAE